MTFMEHPTKANKPDAANPAIALWLAIEDPRRRVADLGRSETLP
jgi:hypothetical protein